MINEVLPGVVVGGAIAIFLGAYVVAKRRHVKVVPTGCVALLYRNGQYAETLAPGRHVRWGAHVGVSQFDLRKMQINVPGQEVLTADNLSVKVSVSGTIQVTDAAKALHESQDWMGDLYACIQMSLRAAIGGVTAEALVGAREGLAAKLLERVQSETTKLGVVVHTLDLRDLVLPPDLKRAFAEVLKAKHEGQAALERARAESAALRNLANAARLLDGNPALQNLRLIQSLASAQKSGNTLVVGVPGGFVPLKREGATSPPAQGTAGEA